MIDVALAGFFKADKPRRVPAELGTSSPASSAVESAVTELLGSVMAAASSPWALLAFIIAREQAVNIKIEGLMGIMSVIKILVRPEHVSCEKLDNVTL